MSISIIKIGKYFLHLPPNHALPQMKSLTPLYDTGYLPVIEAVCRSMPNSWVIDVGANVGDTACAFASVADNPIVCVEGSATFVAYLRRNTNLFHERIQIYDKFLKVPQISERSLGYESHGTTGHFIAGAAPDALGDEDFVTLDTIIERTNGDIALFKADTDGLDIFIVEEFRKRFPDSPAVLFFELNPNYELTDIAYIRSFFQGIADAGMMAAIFDNRGVPLHFFARVDPDNILDLLQYSLISGGVDQQTFHYLDVFLFPAAKQEIFAAIANGYRERRYL